MILCYFLQVLKLTKTCRDWEKDNEIVVAPTGFTLWETETFKITKVTHTARGTDLELNATVNHTHLGSSGDL